MKSEALDKFIGKNVKLTFNDNSTDEGILGKGDWHWGDDKWFGKGYHIIYTNNPYFHSFAFKKSHLKSIEEIP